MNDNARAAGFIQRVVDWAASRPLAVRSAMPLLWAGFLWWVSSRAGIDTGERNMWREFVGNGGHVAVYAILGALWLLALPPRWRIYGSVALAVAYGFVDEMHQSYVPGRSCSVADLCSDACGAVLAVLVVEPYLAGTPGGGDEGPRGPSWGWVIAWALFSLVPVAWATISAV